MRERSPTEEQAQPNPASGKVRDVPRLKTGSLARVSHEIRTQLNGVIGTSGLLLETALTEEQRDYADAVRRSGDGLLSVIEEVLDFSMIEAGELELEAAPLKLRSVVEEVCSLVAPSAHAKGVEVLSDISDDLPGTIVGDSSRLRQVLTNLMANAVKFTPAGTVSAHVTQEPGGASLRFEVKDSGIGIAAATKDGIFEAFVQAHGSTTGQYGGIGLGLAVCEHLIELMGGQIGVESVEGDGSTFWFTLPLREVPSEAQAELLQVGLPDPRESLHARLAGVRVLVIDDNALSRDLLGVQLVAWEMTCDLAGDGETALEMLRAAEEQGLPYGMVLLDAGMPGMDDLELVRLIRCSSPALRVPILMLTSSQGQREAGRRAGADGFLTKPVGRQRLHDAVAEILSLARSEKRPDDPAPLEPFDDGHAHSGSLVLLAEDDEVSRLVAVRMLEKRGFRVDVAVNGRAVLEMCRRRRYKAIFMDCQMPELDGYETTRELRRRESTGHGRVPIIALTASAMKGDQVKCLTAGMDDFVGKPIGSQALDLAIARSLASGSRSRVA